MRCVSFSMAAWGVRMEADASFVAAGVDTHKDVHVLCVIDALGRKVREGAFPATAAGYRDLADAIGAPRKCLVVGIEGDVLVRRRPDRAPGGFGLQRGGSAQAEAGQAPQGGQARTTSSTRRGRRERRSPATGHRSRSLGTAGPRQRGQRCAQGKSWYAPRCRSRTR